MVEFEDGAIRVDVADVQKGLAIETPLVQKGMHEGKITNLCERRLDGNDGLCRVNILSENHHFGLICDHTDNVGHRLATDFGDRNLSVSTRKLGA